MTGKLGSMWATLMIVAGSDIAGSGWDLGGLISGSGSHWDWLSIIIGASMLMFGYWHVSKWHRAYRGS